VADVTAVLVMEAKDRASAQLKTFGQNVQQAGQNAEKAAVGVARTGAATEGMIARLKAAQMPLRNLSAVLGGFGLSFLGISAVTIALRAMISQAMANQQAILGLQINMRRWSLTTDDATRLLNTFRTVLGRTAAESLPAMTEEVSKWLATFGPEGQEWILKAGKRIEDLTKVPLAETLKIWQEKYKNLKNDTNALTAANQELKAELDEIEKAAPESVKQWVAAKKTWLEVGAAWGTVGKQFATGLAMQIEGAKRLPAALTDGIKVWGIWLNTAKEGFQSLWDWVKTDWAKGLEIDLSAPVPRAIEFIKNSWQPMTDFFVEWAKWLHDWFTVRWEMLVAKGAEIWGGFLGFWVQLGNSIVNFWTDRWTAIAVWWVKLITGMANFWAGVWDGMKGVGIFVYNFIIDRLNDALIWANSVIRMINSALGRVGISIPEISLRIARATMPAPEAVFAAPTFTAPALAPIGGGTIIIPVSIGEKLLTEVIVNTLTGAVRQRELSE